MLLALIDLYYPLAGPFSLDMGHTWVQSQTQRLAFRVTSHRHRGICCVFMAPNWQSITMQVFESVYA